MNDIKIVFYQPANPLYREQFYQAMIERFPRMELVIHTSATNTVAEPKAYVSELPVATLSIGDRKLYWARGHSASLTDDKADVVVLGWDVAMLSLVPAILRHRLRGTKVILWGHLFTRGQANWGSRIRMTIGLLANALVTYDEVSADRMRKATKRPVFSVGNGLYNEYVPPSRQIDGETLELLFVARLNSSRGLGEVIDAIADLDVHLTVVGDGVALPELRERAINSRSKVTFLGALYPGEPELDAAFDRAHFFLLPEGGGLGFLNALQRSLPVLTKMSRKWHGPEFQYLNVSNSIDIESTDLRRLFELLLDLDKFRYWQLVDGCRSSASETSCEAFADRFSHVIQSVQGLRT